MTSDIAQFKTELRQLLKKYDADINFDFDILGSYNCYNEKIVVDIKNKSYVLSNDNYVSIENLIN